MWALALLGVSPASAQLPVLPLYGGGFSAGQELTATVGFPRAESRSGEGAAVGTGVTVSFWRMGISGQLARFNPSGPARGTFHYGLQAGLRLLGGGLAPLAIYVIGGAATIDDTSPADRWYLAAALAATLTIPTPLLSIKPWLAPRLDIERMSFQGDTDSDERLGLSAGIDLTLLSGLSFRASYDQVKSFDPIVAFGAALRF